MAISAENYNPFNEEHDDENKRLYSRDKKARNYVPIENLPAYDQELSEQIPADEDFIHPRDMSDNPESVKEYHEMKKSGDIDLSEDDEEKANLLRQEIRFSQVEGAVSVGPNIEGKNIDQYSNKETSMGEVAKGTGAILNMQPESMNPNKSGKDKSWMLRKDLRYPNTGSEHENLKTITDNKKARTFRQKIRDFFAIQNNEETPQHKIEQRFEAIEDASLESQERHKGMAKDYYKTKEGEQEDHSIGKETDKAA